MNHPKRAERARWRELGEQAVAAPLSHQAMVHLNGESLIRLLDALDAVDWERDDLARVAQQSVTNTEDAIGMYEQLKVVIGTLRAERDEARADRDWSTQALARCQILAEGGVPDYSSRHQPGVAEGSVSKLVADLAHLRRSATTLRAAVEEAVMYLNGPGDGVSIVALSHGLDDALAAFEAATRPVPAPEGPA